MQSWVCLRQPVRKKLCNFFDGSAGCGDSLSSILLNSSTCCTLSGLLCVYRGATKWSDPFFFTWPRNSDIVHGLHGCWLKCETWVLTLRGTCNLVSHACRTFHGSTSETILHAAFVPSCFGFSSPLLKPILGRASFAKHYLAGLPVVAQSKWDGLSLKYMFKKFPKWL